MGDVEGARKAFTDFYADLTEVLPMNNLVAELFANKLLPGDHKAKVECYSTQTERAQYFLDAVIKPSLKIGYTEQFYKLITIMESSDDSAVQFLANKMRKHGVVGVPSDFSDHKSKGIVTADRVVWHVF